MGIQSRPPGTQRSKPIRTFSPLLRDPTNLALEKRKTFFDTLPQMSRSPEERVAGHTSQPRFLDKWIWIGNNSLSKFGEESYVHILIPSNSNTTYIFGTTIFDHFINLQKCLVNFPHQNDDCWLILLKIYLVSAWQFII